MITKSTFAIVSAAALCACGQNYADDIPPALIDAIKNPNLPARPDSGPLSYPDPPYGDEPGDTVQDLCFTGWRDPKADGFDPGKAVPICIGEFYDPSGTRNKLLLIESAAVWCAPCRTEYGGSGNRPSLADHLAMRESRGFRLLGTLFQNASAEAATTDDAALWARTFDVSIPFAVDVNHQQLGRYSPSSNIAPFNLLVDTRSMTILLKLAGDEPATLFQVVDDFLAKNAGP